MIREFACAKLNLSLDVQGCREDGYHNMLMVMQTVSVGDKLQLESMDQAEIRLSCNFGYIPTDGRNLAVQAAKLFLETVERPKQGIRIHIRKDIPVGAGMAGGSADAAAVLRGLNRLFDRPLNRKELEGLAQRIGSDVAFCVAGGTSLARGRGEILEDLPPIPDCRIVICKPSFSVSTPELFRKLDQVKILHHPDTEGMLAAIGEGNLRELGMRMYNVFEEVDDRRLRSVREIRSVLLDYGAYGAIMTGTGSAVFGIFAEEAAAQECAKKLQKEFTFCRVAAPTARIEI